MTRSILSSCAGLFVTLLLSGAGSVLASGDDNQLWGTSRSPTAPATQDKALSGFQSPSFIYNNASYGTGGGALRNRGGTTIGVSGVIGPVQAAFLYWAVITDGPPDKSAYRVRLTRHLPKSERRHEHEWSDQGKDADYSRIVQGKVVGSGPQPCWIGTTITVFRAGVPTSLASGNGLYEVTLRRGATGTTDGSDPWATAPLLPLWEGASLVIVGTGTGTIGIYDCPLSGNFILGSFSYTLTLPRATNPGSTTLWDNIGADGQFGASRLDDAALAQETTTINGVPLAGPGSGYNDSDWNGSSGLPLPQLWDDTGHDITQATQPSLPTLEIAITAPADCLTAVANVVEVE
jgi:hypothetical protein